MKIWLINPYGPIPSETWRPYCYQNLAEVLVEDGHEVVWWTSNFAHHFKNFRSAGWNDIVLSAKFLIRLVPTPGYKSNIGFQRLFRDVVFSFRCFRRGRLESQPDLIIFTESPLTFGYAGLALGRFHGCPVVYHQMDLWPELIVRASPAFLRPFLECLLFPIYISRRRVFARLAGCTALAQPYLDAMFSEVVSLKNKPHAVVYNGINVEEFRGIMVAPREWPSGFPVKKDGDIWAVFAGSLGPSYDIANLCEVARLLATMGSNIRIVIAGDGPLKSLVTTVASSDVVSSNLYYVGQLSPADLAALYAKCDVGLCAYSAASNVEMPDKIYDYTAAGLPVLVSLTGEVSDIVMSSGAGSKYTAGSADDLLRKLCILAAEPSLRKGMSVASRDLGYGFDKTVQFRKFLDVIKQVCANG